MTYRMRLLKDVIESMINLDMLNSQDADRLTERTAAAEDILSVQPIDGDTINDAANMVASSYNEYMDVWMILTKIHFNKC